MSTEVAVFWLIHIFMGLVLPLMIYRGCCGVGPVKPQTAEQETRHT